MGKPSNDNADDLRMLVTMTAEDLKRLVQEAVHEAMKGRTAPEYMTADQVGQLIGCATESISTYCTRDGLPCVRIGKIRRFLRDDVLTWLEERRAQPGSHKTKHVNSMSNLRQFTKPQK